MYANFLYISTGYELEPQFLGLELEGNFSEVLYLNRDLGSFIFGHFDGSYVKLGIYEGEIFPEQAYGGTTSHLLAKVEGNKSPPPWNHHPSLGCAKLSSGMAESDNKVRISSVKMSLAQIARIKKAAENEGVTLSDFIRNATSYTIKNVDSLLPIILRGEHIYNVLREY